MTKELVVKDAQDLASKASDAVPNKFLLCVLVSKRARQIKEALPIAHPEDEVVLPIIEALHEIGNHEVSVSYAAQVAKREPKLINDRVLQGSSAQDLASDEDPSAAKKSKKIKEQKVRLKSKSLMV